MTIAKVRLVTTSKADLHCVLSYRSNSDLIKTANRRDLQLKRKTPGDPLTESVPPASAAVGCAERGSGSADISP